MSKLNSFFWWLDDPTEVVNSKPWVPSRPVTKVDPTANQIIDLQAQVTDVVATVATATVPTTPLQILSCSATESPLKRQDRTFSEVSVSYVVNPADPNFSEVRIWFTGYLGSTTPTLITEGNPSPLTFLVETTGETVTVTVQAVSGDGTPADFAFCPTTTVLLDGVVSAPPAPSISQSLISTPVGFQFSFNELGAQAADIVDCYRVYRYTSNASGSASVIQTIKHSPTNSGTIVVQDQIEQYQTRWYWVSAVNTVGLESSLTAAQSGAVVSGSVAQGGAGDNLVYNGDFSIFTPPTGTANSLESQARVDDGGTPNGWCRNFENAGAGEGVCYRVAAAGAAMPSSGAWCLVIQDATAGGNCQFGVVSDAFPVVPSNVYYFSAQFGFNTGIPAGGQWYFRIIYYKQGATDFSTASADRITSSDIVSASGNASTAVYAKALKTPALCGFVRIVFYHWGSTSSQWNMLVSNVRCTNATSSQQVPGVFNAGTFTATNILSNTAGSTVINIASNTVQFGFGQVAYNSGTVNPGSLGTWYVYAIDQGYAGGAVTYLATSNFVNVNAQDWVIYFGSITTTAGGASGGGGSGGSGRQCFSGNVEIRVPEGLASFESLPRDRTFQIVNKYGIYEARLVVGEVDGEMIDMGDDKLVTPTHLMKVKYGWQPAASYFLGRPRVKYKGPVYTVMVLTDDPQAHHFILASGDIAHNVLS